MSLRLEQAEEFQTDFAVQAGWYVRGMPVRKSAGGLKRQYIPRLSCFVRNLIWAASDTSVIQS